VASLGPSLSILEQFGTRQEFNEQAARVCLCNINLKQFVRAWNILEQFQIMFESFWKNNRALRKATCGEGVLKDAAAC
jgi:hypothetical protein